MTSAIHSLLYSKATISKTGQLNSKTRTKKSNNTNWSSPNSETQNFIAKNNTCYILLPKALFLSFLIAKARTVRSERDYICAANSDLGVSRNINHTSIPLPSAG